jgi:sugar lactone lactonase YvrE
MKAELLDPSLPAAELGEGPYWDPGAKKLYWVDITGQAIHGYDPAARAHTVCPTPSSVGFAVMAESGDFVAGLQDGIYSLAFGGGKPVCLAKPDYADKANRFNDGKCDRRGRLWAGTMNDLDHQKPSGAFYRFDKRGLHVQETGIHISNGLGWSPDDKTMYYTDTIKRVIWQYDYDIETGEARNRRTFAEFPGKGRPDGMCVDSQGRILTALWPGWGVEIYAPDGRLEGKIGLPVPQVSSCAFGGDNFKTLFITTAAIGLSAEQLKEAPLAGQMFAIDMDVAGLPETRFRG